MILNNRLIIRGPSHELGRIHSEVTSIASGNAKTAATLGQTSLIKHVKKLKVETYTASDEMVITFQFKGNHVKAFIDLFYSFPIDLLYLTESKKENVWIVSDPITMVDERLIPAWAIEGILYDYMVYLETSIMLDNYSSIQFDQNKDRIVVNKETLSEEQIFSIFYNETINGKPIHRLLEQFTTSFHQACINHYEELYSSNKEKLGDERTTPFALFIVTFGVFGLVILLIALMGYL